MKKHRGRTARYDRVLGTTAMTGISLLLVIGVVFAISYGSRSITSNAVDLHKADESLRSATVVRAQIMLAAYMASVDDHFGTVTIEPRTLSQDEATASLANLERGIEELRTNDLATNTGLVQASDQFVSQATEILRALDDGEVATVRVLVDEPFAQSFQALIGELVAIRNQLASQIEASDSLLGRVGNVARFLVAFFIPAAIVLIYRELAQRRNKEADLENSLETERQLTRYREEFIANASHELRTPLTGIVGMSMLAEEDPTVQQSEMLSEIMRTISTEAHDLSRMVEDLLTTARLDAGALHYVFQDVQIADEIDLASTGLISTGLNVTNARANRRRYAPIRPAFVRSFATCYRTHSSMADQTSRSQVEPQRQRTSSPWPTTATASHQRWRSGSSSDSCTRANG